MRVVAASDWVMDIGPGAGEEGGHVVVSGTPAEVAKTSASRTAAYLAPLLSSKRSDIVANIAHSTCPGIHTT